jgi:hypothetical protein
MYFIVGKSPKNKKYKGNTIDNKLKPLKIKAITPPAR